MAPISSDSTSVIFSGLRLNAWLNAVAVIHPAVPPPAITIRRTALVIGPPPRRTCARPNLDASAALARPLHSGAARPQRRGVRLRRNETRTAGRKDGS